MVEDLPTCRNDTGVQKLVQRTKRIREPQPQACFGFRRRWILSWSNLSPPPWITPREEKWEVDTPNQNSLTRPAPHMLHGKRVCSNSHVTFVFNMPQFLWRVNHRDRLSVWSMWRQHLLILDYLQWTHSAVYVVIVSLQTIKGERNFKVQVALPQKLCLRVYQRYLWKTWWRQEIQKLFSVISVKKS